MIKDQVFLEMKNISKEFPGVKALDAVDFRVFQGEVMGLLGENGAGKSTLMKILSGVYKSDSGSVKTHGTEIKLVSPRDAMMHGIAIIHQELNLIPKLTVGENIFLGREPVSGSGKIKWKKLYEAAGILLKRLAAHISPRAITSNLSIGDQQMVEIAKALSMDAQLLILDEPTDALTNTETKSLFRVIRELKQEGKSIVYISHRISEIFHICDRATVLRDGKLIGEHSVSELTEDKIIEMMVGRKLGEQLPYVQNKQGSILFEAVNLNSAVTKDITFSLHHGEVLGIAGLMGSGRTELALSLYGNYPVTHGTVRLDGEEIHIKNPGNAIRNGIVYVSEDRKQLGLFLDLSIKNNIILPVLKEYEKLFFKTDVRKSNTDVDSYIDLLSIKTTGRSQLVKNLSGGNQQKVSIARGLITKPKLLILDEPTRGVDVGAKQEIYKLINQFKSNGLAIIMISSEMPELIGICDRILVMYNHTLSGELSRKEASQESIMRLAVGLQEKAGD